MHLASCVLPELSSPHRLCAACVLKVNMRAGMVFSLCVTVLPVYDCSLSLYECRMVEYVTPIANPEVIKALQIGA